MRNSLLCISNEDKEVQADVSASSESSNPVEWSYKAHLSTTFDKDKISTISDVHYLYIIKQMPRHLHQ